MFKKIPTPIVLLLPAIIVLAAVVLVPLLLSLYSSFTPFRLTRPQTLYVFVGLRNYMRILTDPVFLAAFVRTIVLLTFALNLEMLLGLGLALLVNKATMGQRVLPCPGGGRTGSGLRHGGGPDEHAPPCQPWRSRILLLQRALPAG